mgnify:CR=1 FL=1
MLTKKQKELLDFLTAHAEKSDVPPSFDEMRDALGLASKSGIHRLVSGLEERGHIRRLANRARAIEILKPVRVEVDGKVAELLPSNSFSVGFEIEFNDRAVAHQEISITLVNGTFKMEIARARTFGFVHEVEALRAAGLGLGGSLDNAVIVDGDKVLNEGGLRYDDEFVRHKVLDAVGDLYLLGHSLIGEFVGHKSGHGLNNRLLRELLQQEDAWEFVEFTDTETSPITYMRPAAG